MKNYLVFQAYGKIEIKYECIFALLQLHTFPCFKNISPVIYTDEPEIFKEIVLLFNEYEIIKLSNEQINKWKGPDKFVHRVKIEMLKDFLAKHNGNVLYCDTDTYFTESPESLFNSIEKGMFYMHTLEGYINHKTHPSFKKWEQFLLTHPEILDQSGPNYVNSLPMWNAGVIGLNNGALPLLNEVLNLTDCIFKKFPKHIAEQFAFSYIFQKHTIIYPADKYIFHYWYLKEFANYLILVFQRNCHLNLLEKFNCINKLPAKLLEEKKQYQHNTRWIKLIAPKWNIKITEG